MIILTPWSKTLNGAPEWRWLTVILFLILNKLFAVFEHITAMCRSTVLSPTSFDWSLVVERFSFMDIMSYESRWWVSVFDWFFVICLSHGHTANLLEPEICLVWRGSNTYFTQWHANLFIMFMEHFVWVFGWCSVCLNWNETTIKNRNCSLFVNEHAYKFIRGLKNHWRFLFYQFYKLFRLS